MYFICKIFWNGQRKYFWTLKRKITCTVLGRLKKKLFALKYCIADPTLRKIGCFEKKILKSMYLKLKISSAFVSRVVVAQILANIKSNKMFKCVQNTIIDFSLYTAIKK